MPQGAHVPPYLYIRQEVRVWKKHGEPTTSVPRYAGVEIEFHDFTATPALEDLRGLHKVITDWDGSIGPDHANVEIRLSPARGAEFSEQVAVVCSTLNSLRPRLTVGCGLHIHVDVSDLKFSDLGRVMVMYAKMEPLLVKTQPFNRMAGKFCKPTGSALAEGWSDARLVNAQERLFEQKANQIINPRELNGNGLQAAQRYKAVNFAAWFKYKTVEVRLHEASVDPEAIILWGKFWTQFVEYAAKQSLADIKRLRRSLTALRDFIERPAVDYVASRIQRYSDQWNQERVNSLMPVVEPQ